MKQTCENCAWWAKYTNGLNMGSCGVPLPPVAPTGEGSIYRPPTLPDYYCVLWRFDAPFSIAGHQRRKGN